MALQFSETAPGVHTSAILNPKTEKRHNIAIIESCDAWQLFIDGELAVRDLPSFKAAVAEAEAKLAAPRTSNMVRAACLLVVLSVAGASTIGMTKVLTPLFSAQTAVAADAADDNGSVGKHRFSRVQPSAAKGASPNPVETAKPAALVEQAVVEVSSAPEAPHVAKSTPAQPERSNAIRVETVRAKKATPQSVTAKPAARAEPVTREVAALGLKPIVTPAPSLYAPSARSKTPSGALPPVVINARPTVSPPVETAPDNDTTNVTGALPPAQPQDLAQDPAQGPYSVDQDVAEVTPPLPGKAPVNAAPLVRSARAPIEPERMTSILAELEVEAREPVTRSIGRATVKRQTIKRRASKRRSTSSKQRRVRRAATNRSYRHARRAHHGHSARHGHRAYHGHRAAPARRMVCFGHTCQFR